MKKLTSIALALCLAAGFLLVGAVPAAAAPDYTPPANLDELSQAEQLDYFNLVVNRVRDERPGFTRRLLLRIDETQLSGLAAIANPIINSIIGQLMPGDWEYRNVPNGQDNTGLFLSDNANASDLRPEDITGISATIADECWLIVVDVAEAVNPMPGTGSSFGRILPIVTREEVIDEITGISSAVKADPANASLRFHDGKIVVIVDPEGKIVSAAGGFNTHALCGDVKISVFLTDVAAAQRSEWQYTGFDWTDASHPFPLFPITKPSPLPPMDRPGYDIELQPWYNYLPPCWQFVLRWFCFGWLWM